MKPRRTKMSICLELPGGNEDNYLWMEKTSDEDGNPVMATFWEPSEYEREAIANGGRVVLFVWGRRHPPVDMGVLAPES